MYALRICFGFQAHVHTPLCFEDLSKELDGNDTQSEENIIRLNQYHIKTCDNDIRPGVLSTDMTANPNIKRHSRESALVQRLDSPKVTLTKTIHNKEDQTIYRNSKYQQEPDYRRPRPTGSRRKPISQTNRDIMQLQLQYEALRQSFAALKEYPHNSKDRIHMQKSAYTGSRASKATPGHLSPAKGNGHEKHSRQALHISPTASDPKHALVRYATCNPLVTDMTEEIIMEVHA